VQRAETPDRVIRGLPAVLVARDLWPASNPTESYRIPHTPTWLDYGSTVNPFVLSVTVTSVNCTSIGGLQSGVNVATSVTV